MISHVAGVLREQTDLPAGEIRPKSVLVAHTLRRDNRVKVNLT